MPERDYDWIARRAYTLWEEEGRPHGADEAHWLSALGDWERLQASADETTEKAGRRIAQAQASAEEEGLIITEEPIQQPRRKAVRSKKG
ncbi:MULTISPECIES: DUF2934 domain-containing protein [Rhizobium]|uniref:DUF2934 domain-containing protein n=1 Tax=Rhizobium wuzhouense TaxID=1986026 RepID=A0ABX5P0Q1_9HYPH|nr:MULTISPECIES: DUF2934 domain-containing protein [Rhizobium]PYB77551.1 hypothetical protein DMY87_04125 [Rhizobium wuzhouense]RKE86226.1 hypothetical protein DFO46_3032 [Rhizobium sp. AG855]